MRGAWLGAQADADELDFRDDETIAAIMLSHEALEMCEAVKVFDEVMTLTLPLAGIPTLVRLDKANDAALAGEIAGLLVGKPGDEIGTILFAPGHGHGVVIVALRREERCIDFRHVEVVDGTGEDI